MIQVSLEVRTGAARFRVMARAQSIQRALSVAGNRYPGGEVRLVLPVEPESFFVDDAFGGAESVGVQIPESVAG